MDLRVERPVLSAKHSQLVELSRDLARCEPRVVSLQEAADNLEQQADSPACRQVSLENLVPYNYILDHPAFPLTTFLQVKRKLALLSQSLRGLRQVVGIYTTSLARALGLPPPVDLPSETFASQLLPPLTERVHCPGL